MCYAYTYASTSFNLGRILCLAVSCQILLSYMNSIELNAVLCTFLYLTIYSMSWHHGASRGSMSLSNIWCPQLTWCKSHKSHGKIRLLKATIQCWCIKSVFYSIFFYYIPTNISKRCICVLGKLQQYHFSRLVYSFSLSMCVSSHSLVNLSCSPQWCGEQLIVPSGREFSPHCIQRFHSEDTGPCRGQTTLYTTWTSGRQTETQYTW